MSSFLNPDEAIDKHRHNLPHWQQADNWIFLTYRLADSLPEAKLTAWREERATWLTLHPEPWDDATEAAYHERFAERINHWLDQGHGSCLLKIPANSEIVANAFHHFDGDRYQLASYVVMPNHVHLLFRPLGENRLPDLLHTWKRFTSREINKREGRSGTLWQADYWDRLIRSQEHFDWALRYIAKNPENLPPGTFRLWAAQQE
jgi:REP element-mobilizing transposase RayT